MRRLRQQDYKTRERGFGLGVFAAHVVEAGHRGIADGAGAALAVDLRHAVHDRVGAAGLLRVRLTRRQAGGVGQAVARELRHKQRRRVSKRSPEGSRL